MVRSRPGACLEAASVPAFERLARELELFGAPPDLIGRARRARADEVRHQRIMGSLARRFGGEVAAPTMAPFRRRSLEEMASENAGEGCVRETFGAALAAHQGRRSSLPGLRQAMVGIARDEAEHAALAWEVDRWAWDLLDGAGRRRVRDRRRATAAELLTEVRASAEVSPALGLPAPAALQALAMTAHRELWAVT
jgi:hypothetical protein